VTDSDADNNWAERLLRPLVIGRTISGGTRTHMRLSSLFATWQARGLSPFQACLSLCCTFVYLKRESDAGTSI
jgi:hypothetical protein